MHLDLYPLDGTALGRGCDHPSESGQVAVPQSGEEGLRLLVTSTDTEPAMEPARDENNRATPRIEGLPRV